MSLDIKNIDEFHFKDYSFDEDKGEFTFNYSLGNQFDLSEKLLLHNYNKNPENKEIINKGAKLLHLMLGISYYKTIGFKKIVATNINKEISDFFTHVYSNGLGEFAYNNKLTNQDDINFPINSDKKLEPLSLSNSDKILVPFGGGKDSLLSVTLLKKKYNNIHLFALARPGQEDFYSEFAKKLKLPIIVVTRTIDSQISKLNQQGAYNGHVPFSAILAFTLAAIAPIYNFKTAILSNEDSANYSNLRWNDREINHQYSKSFDFEKRFNSFIKSNFLSNFEYFSLLRPFSELKITKELTNTTDYDSLFTSCNRFFAKPESLTSRWCEKCPKCAFFFLLAAPFWGKERMLNIFSKNLLDITSLDTLYEELTGLTNHKPFDCVGDYNEALSAFYLLSKDHEWQNDHQVLRFKNDFLSKIDNLDKLLDEQLELKTQHLIPEEFLSTINSI